MNPVHFSSATAEWSTPADFFAGVEAEFGPFDLDPCATAENAKATVFYTKEQDGLEKPWFGKVFLNPPYGRGISDWIEEAVAATSEFGKAELVVALLPARVDTRWWHDLVVPYASEIQFIRGRLKFGGAKHSAPFPSALVIFRRSGTTKES